MTVVKNLTVRAIIWWIEVEREDCQLCIRRRAVPGIHLLYCGKAMGAVKHEARKMHLGLDMAGLHERAK
jgi:hypothetical protein